MKICLIEECDSKQIARGWCSKHYQRWLRTGDPLKVRQNKENSGVCSILNCGRVYYGLDFCERHYKRFKKYGDPLAARKPMPSGYGKGWYDSDGYRCISVNGTPIKEHRYVMEQFLGRTLEPAPIETVHHINGIRDDNNIENLQLRRGDHGIGVVFQCIDCGSCNVKAVEIQGGGN